MGRLLGSILQMGAADEAVMAIMVCSRLSLSGSQAMSFLWNESHMLNLVPQNMTLEIGSYGGVCNQVKSS